MRGLQIPGSTTSRIAACWFSGASFTIDVNLTDGQVHPVSLYAVDWDSMGRSEQIQVLDGSSGAVLNTQTISSFSGGEYLTWNVSGHVQFVVTSRAGDQCRGERPLYRGRLDCRQQHADSLARLCQSGHIHRHADGHGFRRT